MSGVAIFHDNFAQMGGAERVAEILATALPGATLHTTLAAHAKLIPALREREIRTTWMQHLPDPGRYYRHYFLLYPLAIEGADLSRYDLVLSNCFGYAKGVHARRDAVHVCYCQTPMRWVWRSEDYFARERFGTVQTAAISLLLRGLRRWDLRAARSPDFFIANSQGVAARIRECYNRDSVVIHPPIEFSRFRTVPGPGQGYLVVTRLSAYKRIDLAIRACNLLRRPLVIIGDGPDRARLEQLAGPTITFRGRVPDDDVVTALAECRALLFPGEEDFGMTPLEANASGRPVVAWRGGGALETIVDGKTGLFFEEATPESLAAAIERSERETWDPTLLRAHAATFDRAVFSARMLGFLRSVAPSKVVASALDAAGQLPARTAWDKGAYA